MTKSIQETSELLAFASQVADHAKLALKDGKIDLVEIGTMVKNLAPEAIKASWGVWEIPGELSELDPQESKKLISDALLVIWKYVELFALLAK